METEKKNEFDETEDGEDYVINQIFGLFNFSRTNGSITQYIGLSLPTRKIDQSQSGARTGEQNHQNNYSVETNTSQNPINSIQTINRPSKSKMDKISGKDMDFSFKKRGNSPETVRLRNERNRNLQPQPTRIVGKRKRYRAGTGISPKSARQETD